MTTIADFMGEEATKNLMGMMEDELLGVALGLRKDAPVATILIKVLFLQWAQEEGVDPDTVKVVRPQIKPPALEVEWKDETKEKTLIPLPWRSKFDNAPSTLM